MAAQYGYGAVLYQVLKVLREGGQALSIPSKPEKVLVANDRTRMEVSKKSLDRLVRGGLLVHQTGSTVWTLPKGTSSTPTILPAQEKGPYTDYIQHPGVMLRHKTDAELLEVLHLCMNSGKLIRFLTDNELHRLAGLLEDKVTFDVNAAKFTID